MINKKYIFSILFLFSSQNTLSISITENLSSYIPIKTAIAIGCALGIAKIAKEIIISKIRISLCTIFKAHMTTGYVDWETTLGWIENYPYSSLINVMLEILLFFDPETHYELNTYITELIILTQDDSKAEDKTIKIMSFLFKCGIDPRKIPYYKGSILTKAALFNCSEIVKLLLSDYKINPDDENLIPKYLSAIESHSAPTIYSVNKFALQAACHENNNEIVELLIQHNTNVHPFLDQCLFQVPIEKAIENNNKKMVDNLILFTLGKNKNIPAVFQLITIFPLSYEIHNLIKREYLATVGYGNVDSIIDNCCIYNQERWPLQYSNELRASSSFSRPYRLMFDNQPWYDCDCTNARNSRSCDCANQRIADIKHTVKNFLSTL